MSASKHGVHGDQCLEPRVAHARLTRSPKAGLLAALPVLLVSVSADMPVVMATPMAAAATSPRLLLLEPLLIGAAAFVRSSRPWDMRSRVDRSLGVSTALQRRRDSKGYGNKAGVRTTRGGWIGRGVGSDCDGGRGQTMMRHGGRPGLGMCRTGRLSAWESALRSRGRDNPTGLREGEWRGRSQWELE